ncbi:MAG TPA: hypothetical protein VK348_08260, partial [Planctomycetota bacterium]|nr:hypothetical protein [Planctomycetota bacterium]
MRCPGPIVLAAAMLFAANSPAQQNLAELQRTFESEWKQLGSGSESNQKQRQELLQRHAGMLAQFLTDKAKGDDRWNGRLMLADLRVALADQAGAKTALQAIDAEQAPGLVLLTGADMAGRLGLPDLRARWIDAALQKGGKLEERMAMARVLMTLLREVKRGEAVIEQALAAAKDDEARATVLWHRADCIREREDLPENAYFDALDQLAKDLPNTWYGGIDRDRSAASKFQLG